MCGTHASSSSTPFTAVQHVFIHNTSIINPFQLEIFYEIWMQLVLMIFTSKHIFTHASLQARHARRFATWFSQFRVLWSGHCSTQCSASGAVGNGKFDVWSSTIGRICWSVWEGRVWKQKLRSWSCGICWEQVVAVQVNYVTVNVIWWDFLSVEVQVSFSSPIFSHPILRPFLQNGPMSLTRWRTPLWPSESLRFPSAVIRVGVGTKNVAIVSFFWCRKTHSFNATPHDIQN